MHERLAACRLGSWASALTALAAVAALGIATTTAPARSGPFCLVEDCITYPYTDAAEFVPNDYIWMYPALLMALLFAVLAACIHLYARAGARVFALVALVFATVAAGMLAANYFIQLAVVQPSLQRGEVEDLSLLSQYNPHGVFIALEDAGYLLMGAAFLFLAPVFDGRERLDRAVRWLLVVAGVLAVGSLVVLAAAYRGDLEYRYEVVAIVVDWVALIVLGALLALLLRRDAGRLEEAEAGGAPA